MEKRAWEIDYLRGIAIILMILFHLIFDLTEFYNHSIPYLSGFWYYEGKMAAILFIFVSGISSNFSERNLQRGVKVFGFGMLLSVVTFIPFPQDFIKFGILHFFGISMIIYHFIRKLDRKYLLLIAVAAIIVGNIFDKMTVSVPYLFPIGLLNNSFSSLDYYPLLPWIGVFLFGAVIGKTFYKKRESIFKFEAPSIKILSYHSQHSILIYLLQQPILLALLYIIHKLL